MSAGPAVAAALAGAALFAVASATQHQEARAVERSASPSLLVTLGRRPLWLAGIVADVAAVGLQALALRLGSVSLVQVVLVAGLPLAALLSALLERRRLRRSEVGGLLLTSAGLALLGPALTSTPSGAAPSRGAAVVAGLVLAAAVLPLLALRGHPRWGGLCAGTAAGAVIGAGSVLLAVTAGRVGDWGALLGSVAPYAAVVVGLLGLLLAQVAFQTGALGGPLAALSLAEPVVAVVLAATVLHEHLPSSAGTRALAVVGAATAAAGVLALCAAPAQASGEPCASRSDSAARSS